MLCNFYNDSQSFNFGPFDCFPTNSITTPEATPTITAYPNPAKDRITFDFGGAVFETLQVINTAGVVVREARLGGQTHFSLPLKGLPTGIYSCILSGKDGTATEKIIVE
ncbi:MAG: T9SS type A sorting domain-containing protein [Bacteroidales bacterium]|nr:T9SS type A sorting domain-containing protein [Bacteroidales bacterium]MBP5240882.1 T9SS type A sorting domain-containing protein [Bacteroidales bacterium]